MPVHDWTNVDACIFYALHLHWLSALVGALNVHLPSGYYCLPEQVRGPGTTYAEAIASRQKSLVIRHVTGHCVVAIIEVVSPNNKSSVTALKAMAEKAGNFLRAGVHLLFLDLFPPSARDPNGIHPLIWSQIEDQPFTLPPDKPLTLAAYSAGLVVEAFIEPVAVGDALPDMPLFLTPGAHVPVPLEASYAEAWSKIPSPWREVIAPPPA